MKFITFLLIFAAAVIGVGVVALTEITGTTTAGFSINEWLKNTRVGNVVGLLCFALLAVQILRGIFQGLRQNR